MGWDGRGFLYAYQHTPHGEFQADASRWTSCNIEQWHMLWSRSSRVFINICLRASVSKDDTHNHTNHSQWVSHDARLLTNNLQYRDGFQQNQPNYHEDRFSLILMALARRKKDHH